MCHQYAYASTLVDECLPILEGLDPMPHRWEWPTESCPDPPALPPFNNTVEKDDKVTSDDSDDDINEVIAEPELKTYAFNPGKHHSEDDA